MAVRAPHRGERLHLGNRFCLRVRHEGHEEQRSRRPFDDIREASVFVLLSREAKDRSIHKLNGNAEPSSHQPLWRAPHHGREVPHAHCLCSRPLYKTELSLGDEGERPFGAHDESGEVDLIHGLSQEFG